MCPIDGRGMYVGVPLLMAEGCRCPIDGRGM